MMLRLFPSSGVIGLWKQALGLICLTFPFIHYAQSPSLSALAAEIKRLEQDPDMRSASWGVAVMEVETGNLLASYDPHRSLATASTMKAISSATALEILGPDFRFQTSLAFDGRIVDSVLRGNLYIQGDGDPTLGSNRFGEPYALPQVLGNWIKAIREAGIKQVLGAVVGDARIFSTQMIPAKWSWEDMGNYYGTGVAGLNIHENQYRLDFRSGRPGTLTEVLRTEPNMFPMTFINEVLAGPVGSGDNAYIFGAPYTDLRYVRGTIAPNRSHFSIKGSMADPALTTASWLRDELENCGIDVTGSATTMRQLWAQDDLPMSERQVLHRLNSPTLAEIVQETNFQSVNLFAEALARRAAVKQGEAGSNEAAIGIMQAHWRKRGLNTRGLDLRDASGLAATNGVSAFQMAQILALAAKGPGSDAFYQSLPVAGRDGTLRRMMIGTAAEGRLRAKSGFVSGVRSYAGYVDLPGGKRVAFAMLANRFSCGPGEMRRKLERLMVALAKGA